MQRNLLSKNMTFMHLPKQPGHIGRTQFHTYNHLNSTPYDHCLPESARCTSYTQYVIINSSYGYSPETNNVKH